MWSRPAGSSLICLAALACASALAPARPARADAPTLGGVSPLGVVRGQAVEMTLSGGNLGANPRLVAPFSAQVEPAAMPGDAGAYRLKITVPAGVPLGVYPVRVATDEGISNPLLVAVAQVPPVAEVEPNDVFEKAQTVAVPAAVEGQAAGTDVDFVRFTGRKGQRVLIDAQCARLGSGVDPQVRLTTASRRFVASGDDAAGLGTDARIVAELPEDGDYVVELSDTKYQGGGRPVYRLMIGEIPAVEEVYPLGGRRGEAVGFELRGGSIGAGAGDGDGRGGARRPGCGRRRAAGAGHPRRRARRAHRPAPRRRADGRRRGVGAARAARAGRRDGGADPGRRPGRAERPDRPGGRRGPLPPGGGARAGVAHPGAGGRPRLGARRQPDRAERGERPDDRRGRRHGRSPHGAARPAAQAARHDGARPVARRDGAGRRLGDRARHSRPGRARRRGVRLPDRDRADRADIRAPARGRAADDRPPRRHGGHPGRARAAGVRRAGRAGRGERAAWVGGASGPRRGRAGGWGAERVGGARRGVRPRGARRGGHGRRPGGARSPHTPRSRSCSRSSGRCRRACGRGRPGRRARSGADRRARRARRADRGRPRLPRFDPARRGPPRRRRGEGRIDGRPPAPPAGSGGGRGEGRRGCGRGRGGGGRGSLGGGRAGHDRARRAGQAPGQGSIVRRAGRDARRGAARGARAIVAGRRGQAGSQGRGEGGRSPAAVPSRSRSRSRSPACPPG